MNLSDPLGDLLTRIRNAQRSRHTQVVTTYSRLHENVLDVLKREGYIRSWQTQDVRQGVKAIRVELKYSEGEPAIREINRVSTPGRRVYSKIRDLPRVYAGLGVSILSTPKGVMSDNEARTANVGGEVLCRVF
jgi:small subunit ribosomal protein S8